MNLLGGTFISFLKDPSKLQVKLVVALNFFIYKLGMRNSLLFHRLRVKLEE